MSSASLFLRDGDELIPLSEQAYQGTDISHSSDDDASPASSSGGGSTGGSDGGSTRGRCASSMARACHSGTPFSKALRISPMVARCCNSRCRAAWYSCSSSRTVRGTSIRTLAGGCVRWATYPPVNPPVNPGVDCGVLDRARRLPTPENLGPRLWEPAGGRTNREPIPVGGDAAPPPIPPPRRTLGPLHGEGSAAWGHSETTVSGGSTAKARRVPLPYGREPPERRAREARRPSRR